MRISGFNNLKSARKPISNSYVFECEHFSFLYTYIRKNACSSFKYLYLHINKDVIEKETKKTALQLMKPSIYNPRQPSRIDRSLFVYRDPIQRLSSAVKDKLIQARGGKDVLSSLSRKFNCPIEELTLDCIVKDYLCLLKTDRVSEVDPHFWPQQWHLLPIKYDMAIELSTLHAQMSSIIPVDICNACFKNPINTTGGFKLVDFDVYSPIGKYITIYQRDSFLPNIESGLSDEIKFILADIYKDDYTMITEINSIPVEKPFKK